MTVRKRMKTTTPSIQSPQINLNRQRLSPQIMTLDKLTPQNLYLLNDMLQMSTTQKYVVLSELQTVCYYLLQSLSQ
jgi:hypothetical protein